MADETIASLISSLGFPIAVAAWFMWRTPRTEAIIDANTKAMQSLSDRIARCPFKKDGVET